MFSMSYEDIITIIFVAVQVVKKEVIVHRPKTSVGPIPSDTVKVGHPAVQRFWYGWKM